MNIPDITVNEELRAYIDPLTPEEHQALERSILAEGCRDALVLWGDVLVDGHNRYGICSKHGIPFQTVQNTRFKSMDDVHLWMIDQHLGRRSVSDFQRGVLALRKKEIVAARTLPTAPAEHAENSSDSAEQALAETQAPVAPPDRLNTREAIAKAARISANTVVQIEKIQKSATPELVEAVKAGTISINAAATVASLPEEEQKAAVAGGKKELQQAAKRVREGKSGRRAELAGDAAPDDENAAGDPKTAEPLSAEERDQRNREAQVKLLQSTVQELTEENKALKAQVASLTAQLNAATSADGV